MKAPSERTPSLSSGSEDNVEKSADEIDPPPAYSLAAFCTKRETKWHATLPIATAVVSALLFVLLVGGLLFENSRLNGVIGERDAVISQQMSMIERLGGLCEVKKAEWKSVWETVEAKEEEPAAEIRECWSRVANLTKELAVHKQEAIARIARLETEAGRLNAELAASSRELKELVNEKATWTRKNERPVEQRQLLRTETEEPMETTAATTELLANSTSNTTSTTHGSECSAWCWVVKTITPSRLKTAAYIDAFMFLLALLFIFGFAVLLVLGFVGLCRGVYKMGCRIYGQRSPPLRYWGWVLLVILGIVGLFWGVAGLRDLMNLCFK